jgi:hypothetical protein
MKQGAWSLAVVAALVASGCATTAEEPAAAAAEKEYTQEEEFAAWMAVANPGPEHERMAAECGEWTVACKVWMAPGAPPEESTAKATMRMLLDGRFQEMEYQGSMMGMPFVGRSLTGFDRYQKKFVSTWCDSMGTMIMMSKGDFDPEGKVRTMRSEFTDPLGRACSMRMVSRAVDADHMHWEMYGATGSKPETKVMEMSFTRVKK